MDASSKDEWELNPNRLTSPEKWEEYVAQDRLEELKSQMLLAVQCDSEKRKYNPSYNIENLLNEFKQKQKDEGYIVTPGYMFLATIDIPTHKNSIRKTNFAPAQEEVEFLGIFAAFLRATGLYQNEVRKFKALLPSTEEVSDISKMGSYLLLRNDIEDVKDALNYKIPKILDSFSIDNWRLSGPYAGLGDYTSTKDYVRLRFCFFGLNYICDYILDCGKEDKEYYNQNKTRLEKLITHTPESREALIQRHETEKKALHEENEALKEQMKDLLEQINQPKTESESTAHTEKN